MAYQITMYLSRSKKSIVLLAFFLSGVTALVYQVVWSRLLVLSFGCTIYSVSIVLASFMGGLAIGSFLGGYWADRTPSPIKIYAVCELLVGIFALVAFLLLREMPSIAATLRKNFAIPYSGFSLWVLIVNLGILLPPTIFMGATLPLLSKGLTRSVSTGGMDIGDLYAINTVGAALGALLTGFITIAILGLQRTFLVAMFINLILGGLIYLLFRKDLSVENHKFPENIQKPLDDIDNTDSYNFRWVLSPIVLAFFVSGFVSLSIEVLWTRILAPYLENSVYSFSLILVVILLGIALGSWSSRKMSCSYKHPVRAYGACQILVGIFNGLSLVMALLFIKRFAWVLPDLGVILSHSSVIIKGLIWFGIILFPMAFAMGLGFPFVAQWASSKFGELGRRVGIIYALNTVGAVSGSLCAGFLIIPIIGVKNGIVIMTLLSVLSGGYVLISDSEKSPLYIGKTTLLVMVVVIFSYILAYSLPDPARVATLIAYPSWNIVAHKDDPEATVSMLRYEDNNVLSMQLNINLRPVSGNSNVLTAWMAFLPLFLSQERVDCSSYMYKCLIIGLGYGNTFSRLVEYPNTEVSVVELVPSVLEFFKRFNHESKLILNKPNAKVVLGDGRNYLLSTNEKFDLVVIDPTPPIYGAGGVNLYTADFFKICADRLKRFGVMLLRIPYSADKLTINLILKTAVSVFKHVSLWKQASGFLLLGSSSDVVMSPDKLRDRVRKSKVLTEYAKRFLIKTQPFLIMYDDQIKKLVKEYKVVTDDMPYLEYPLFFRWWNRSWHSIND